MKLTVVINQIVGSAPGFPHGVIDPIEVSFSIFFHLMLKKNISSTCLLYYHNADNLAISSVGTWSSGIKLWYLFPCGPLPWWLCITICS